MLRIQTLNTYMSFFFPIWLEILIATCRPMVRSLISIAHQTFCIAVFPAVINVKVMSNGKYNKKQITLAALFSNSKACLVRVGTLWVEAQMFMTFSNFSSFSKVNMDKMSLNVQCTYKVTFSPLLDKTSSFWFNYSYCV